METADWLVNVLPCQLDTGLSAPKRLLSPNLPRKIFLYPFLQDSAPKSWGGDLPRVPTLPTYLSSPFCGQSGGWSTVILLRTCLGFMLPRSVECFTKKKLWPTRRPPAEPWPFTNW